MRGIYGTAYHTKSLALTRVQWATKMFHETWESCWSWFLRVGSFELACCHFLEAEPFVDTRKFVGQLPPEVNCLNLWRPQISAQAGFPSLCGVRAFEPLVSFAVVRSPERMHVG